jgi:putative MATE family efflux protein
MLAGNLLQALYNTVDSIWVGRYVGPDALGAVSVSFPIIFALIALIMGLTMATTTLVAQYKGAGDDTAVRQTVSNSLKLLAGLGVVSSAIGLVFRMPLLRLINTPEAILVHASSYLGIFLAGMVGMFLYNAGSAILRGLGDSRTPLRFLAIATAINIVLDPLMILGVGPFPKMGVAGAALATIIAQGVSSVLVLRHLSKVTRLLHFEGRLLSVDRRITKLTFSIGLPAGVQQFLASLGMLTLTSIINRFGATVVAAFGAAARLDQFATMPAMSIGMATAALCGQNLGAGKEERVREVVRSSAVVSVALTGTATVIALAIPGVLFGVFTRDAGVLAEGVRYLRIVAWSYVPFALFFVFTGVLRGAGDTVPPMVITVVNLWIVRVPLAQYLSSIPALGIRGVWIANAVTPVAGLALSYAYYRTGRWKARVVARRARAVGPEGQPVQVTAIAEGAAAGTGTVGPIPGSGMDAEGTCRATGDLGADRGANGRGPASR